VPALIKIGGQQTSTATVALLGEAGLAALTRPPDAPVPVVDRDKLFLPESPAVLPFALFVRQYGTDESVAARLLSQVRAWESAGRPSADGMQIHAYRKDSEHAPSQNDFVIEKQWTKLVIAWPLSGSA
jgi:hypothetical protein